MTNPAIHPVILPVPQTDQPLNGRPKVELLRKTARKALALSAAHAGLMLGPLQKDAHGAPLPSNGVFWSLSHKALFVAAVAAPVPIGIDLERFKPVSQALYRRLAETSEWELAADNDETTFFRYWTAKEAVLKAVGKGLTGLSACRVTRIVSQDELLLTYEHAIWRVTHFRLGQDHLVTLTTDHHPIAWHAATEVEP